ncbi:MAG: lysylphosphatidylglycerol synthase transmembrane domain-containing protein [Bacteroidales bacterium]|nr:lysylphosphatidylglycerol synthase transmembrane domain-containing protein [Bacteroidales bacterium]MDY0253837.1 lysylphosphatidylglycerol synthase transmembrane domain-containing protein [Tenuifilaceae bacterium]
MSPKRSNQQSDNPLSKIKLSRAIYPIIIGLGVVGYMFYREFDPSVFTYLSLAKWSFVWFVVALALMAFRDIGYIIRLLILAEGQLSLRQAFRVVMLWEFTSAITPSAIGGTSVAILYVNKEGISVGRSSAIVMATSLLDELYFLLMFPLLLLFVKTDLLFGVSLTDEVAFANELFTFALIGYLVKLLYVIVLSYGLFFNPRGLKWLMLMIFKLPILRRWKHGANDAGTEIIENSKEFKAKPFGFWFKSFLATAFSWTSRYWVVNALLLAFFAVTDHFLIFARQLVMWIMMLVSPTPGGSGFAEFVFTRFLGEFMPVEPIALGSVAVAMALIWRLATYYPYLVIGAIMFPRWIKSKFGSEKV